MGHPEKRAPPPLDQVQEFLNTRSLMRGFDLLALDVDARQWLKERGIKPGGKSSAASLSADLRELREVLRLLIAQHGRNAADNSGIDAVLHHLDRFSASAAARPSWQLDGTVDFRPQKEGAPGLVVQLASAIMRSQANGTWRRLKICPNPECQWAFYDRSKNRSAVWCVTEICGARSKVRAYRKRLKG